MSFDYDSEEWAEERAEVLEDWDGCCERCGVPTESPHVHHKYGTSQRVYEVLCPNCHADHHGNPEIADCRKKTTRCKFCSMPIRWQNQDGRWVPLELHSPNRHQCKRRM